MRLTLAALMLAPGLAFAAGGGEVQSPPKKTETTENCFSERQWDPEQNAWVRYSEPVNGVWDAKIEKCIRPDRSSSLDSETLKQAVRELAYAGRLEEAQMVLAGMSDQMDDVVLTYWGFTHRKLGNPVEANAFYQKAIAKNPDNLLARSYMGQGFVSAGDTDAAIEQWQEIVARGGQGGWPEDSLRTAIRTGLTYNY